VTFSGCSAQQLSAEKVKEFADPMTENILLAMNEDDYPRFSQDFDEQMKAVFNEAQYNQTIPAIKAKIGQYVSKEYVSAEYKDGFTVVVYKARFSQEANDIIVTSVFSDTNVAAHAKCKNVSLFLQKTLPIYNSKKAASRTAFFYALKESLC
jgi:hypothetical protein